MGPEGRRPRESNIAGAPARPPVPSLDVRSLCVEYERGGQRIRAVDGASFSLGPGESLGIAGESACGKSSVGLALMRSLPAGGSASGRVRLGGESILDMPESEFDASYRWKRVSMVFQAAMNSLDPVYTIGDQLAEVMAEHGRGAEAGDAALRAVEAVGLGPQVLHRYPHEISGGMRQRAVIAMALMLDPQLVIADEPTTALDVLVQAQVMDVLAGIKARGASIVFITHDLALLAEIADKVAVMYAGQIVEFGEARQIYSDAQHPYTQALIAATPTLGGVMPQSIPGAPPDLARPGTACRFAPRCARAFEKCARDPPEIRNDSGYARCWLYE